MINVSTLLKTKIFFFPVAIFFVTLTFLTYLWFFLNSSLFSNYEINSQLKFSETRNSKPIQVCKPEKAVIVTAANRQYYTGLVNLIGSVHFWEPDRKIAVYNLGLTNEQLNELSSFCKVTVHWPSGIPSYIPAYANKLKAYGWKPFAIKDAVDRYGKIFYIDCGSDLRSTLEKMERDLDYYGFYVIISPHKLDYLLHQGMYDYFNLSKRDFFDKQGIAGGYQGFVKGSAAYFQLLSRYVACAIEPLCFSPPWATKTNHRFDQSALALVLHTSPIDWKNCQHVGEEHPSRKYFQEDPTIQSERMFYTGRRKSSDYAKYAIKKKVTLDCEGFEKGNVSCHCG